MVCNGELDLREAQREISADCTESYLRRFRHAAERGSLPHAQDERCPSKVFRVFES
jgi:hypothetical protein